MMIKTTYNDDKPAEIVTKRKLVCLNVDANNDWNVRRIYQGSEV